MEFEGTSEGATRRTSPRLELKYACPTLNPNGVSTYLFNAVIMFKVWAVTPFNEIQNPSI